jgi:tRNA U38,U39,U40 pseudouridine synthase TruA
VTAAPCVKLKLTVAYDGAAYQGWQVQKIGRGVQPEVEAALRRLFPSVHRLHSSSRTDTGKHDVGSALPGGAVNRPGVLIVDMGIDSYLSPAA